MADPLARLVDSEQFRRFLGHQDTPADEAELRQLALRAGLDLTDLDGLRETVNKGELWRQVARKTGLDPELIWDRPVLRSPPGTGRTATATTTLRLPRRRGAPWWVGVAAAAALVTGGALLWRGVIPERTTPMRTVETQAGERIQYRLPDGTRVVLAPESELRFAGWDSSGPREVALEGEAYFDVVHDETRPFRVRIADALIEDLGTEFVVRAYPRDGLRQVAVRAGLVAVRSRRAPASRETVLRAGDVARVDSRGFAAKISADTGALFGWMQGQLAFHDAPVSDVLRQLRRWYGVEIVATDSLLLSTRLTLAITERNTPAEAVAYVAALADARVEHRDRVFVLRR